MNLRIWMKRHKIFRMKCQSDDMSTNRIVHVTILSRFIARPDGLDPLPPSLPSIRVEKNYDSLEGEQKSRGYSKIHEARSFTNRNLVIRPIDLFSTPLESLGLVMPCAIGFFSKDSAHLVA